MMVRILYVTGGMVDSDPKVQWVRTLAAKPQVEYVRVLATRVGANLPKNVEVRHFRGPTDFYRAALPLRRRDVDFFFLRCDGPYPTLLLPLKLALRRPMYQWKAHPRFTWRFWLQSQYFDDLVFTATPSSIPFVHDKVRVVGHGIDTARFRPQQGPKDRDLIAVGRIAQIKRLEWAIRAVAECQKRYGLELTLDLVGPCSRGNERYEQKLRQLIGVLGLDNRVRLLGAVDHRALPELLSHYRACVNLPFGAFDKAAGEAMAAGLPVLTTNRCTEEVLPEDLRPALVAGEDDFDGLVVKMMTVATWDDATVAEIGHRLRKNVVDHHSLSALFDKILDLIETDRRSRRSWSFQ